MSYCSRQRSSCVSASRMPSVMSLMTVGAGHVREADLIADRGPSGVPSSSAIRAATLRAAIRRGWVWPISLTPRPSSRQILGNWVDLPEPVSPQTITTRSPRWPRRCPFAGSTEIARAAGGVLGWGPRLASAPTPLQEREEAGTPVRLCLEQERAWIPGAAEGPLPGFAGRGRVNRRTGPRRRPASGTARRGRGANERAFLAGKMAHYCRLTEQVCGTARCRVLKGEGCAQQREAVQHLRAGDAIVQARQGRRAGAVWTSGAGSGRRGGLHLPLQGSRQGRAGAGDRGAGDAGSPEAAWREIKMLPLIADLILPRTKSSWPRS